MSGGKAKVDDPPVALFKAGKRKYMLELIDEGHLYLNPLRYFKTLGDKSSRSDPDEATALAWQTHGYTLDVDVGSGWQRVGTIDGATRLHDEELQKANVYSLYARRRSQCTDPWSMAELGFGQAFVAFTNANEFFRRVESAARAVGQSASFGLVEYVDKYEFQGLMGAFRKFSEHARQSEFRIVLTPGTDSPLSLRLGSLRDIAVFVEGAGRVLVTPGVVRGRSLSSVDCCLSRGWRRTRL